MTDAPAYQFCPCCGATLDSRILKAGEPPRLVWEVAFPEIYAPLIVHADVDGDGDVLRRIRRH